MPNYSILQMKLADKRVHEQAIEQDKITAKDDGFNKLSSGDIVLVASGSHPYALVEVIEEIPNEQKIEPTFEGGKDFKINNLGFFKDDKAKYSKIKGLSGIVPRDGTFLPLNDTNKSTYKLIAEWHESIKNKKNMQLDILYRKWFSDSF